MENTGEKNKALPFRSHNSAPPNLSDKEKDNNDVLSKKNIEEESAWGKGRNEIEALYQ